MIMIPTMLSLLLLVLDDDDGDEESECRLYNSNGYFMLFVAVWPPLVNSILSFGCSK